MFHWGALACSCTYIQKLNIYQKDLNIRGLKEARDCKKHNLQDFSALTPNSDFIHRKT
jgi:hypothetical protein